MGRAYAKYEDKFAVYSTIPDGFITDLMTRDELQKWCSAEYGRSAMPIHRTEWIDFDEAICNWINSQPVYDEDAGVIAWLKRNNIERGFEFKCYLDKDNFYIFQEAK